MIYTADKFAAHLIRRGAAVSVTQELFSDGLIEVEATSSGSFVVALFDAATGRFRTGAVATEHPSGCLVNPRSTRSLKVMVDALHLPAAA